LHFQEYQYPSLNTDSTLHCNTPILAEVIIGATSVDSHSDNMLLPGGDHPRGYKTK